MANNTTTAKKSKAVSVKKNKTEEKGFKVSVDYMLRTSMQHHIQLSAMADQKANIIIGTNALIFSIILSQLKLNDPVWGLFSLCVTSIVALVFSIMAVIPSYGRKKQGQRRIMGQNMLFFGHFTDMAFENYLAEMTQIANNNHIVFESMVHDLYQLGKVLKTRKYKFLTLSYRVFLIGIILSMVLIVAQVIID